MESKECCAAVCVGVSGVEVPVKVVIAWCWYWWQRSDGYGDDDGVFLSNLGIYWWKMSGTIELGMEISGGCAGAVVLEWWPTVWVVAGVMVRCWWLQVVLAMTVRWWSFGVQRIDDDVGRGHGGRAMILGGCDLFIFVRSGGGVGFDGNRGGSAGCGSSDVGCAEKCDRDS
ncbi:Hypothetical predicted protein [Olea europaea subsp. europaea]|uniref:Transmembrane protein n=1 Tax=Olea europaea subsp. europaea TaxID=158383 RepID=A0A8S0TGT6_OLEEU|nr:Hypothetical predicted protein [Olea europaea subsp. europaea]